MIPTDLQGIEHYRSIKRNIRVIVILVSFIPLIAVSSGILLQFHSSYGEKVRAHLETLVKKHRQNIDHFLTERQNNIAMLASLYSYEDLCKPDQISMLLQRLQENYSSMFSDIGVVRADGAQISYAGPFALASAQYSEAGWFQKAIRADAYTSDVFLGLRGFPHFIVAVRRHWNGEPWILRATVEFHVFKDLVESIQLGKTGRAYIINREGKLQTSTSGRLEPGEGSYFGLIGEDDLHSSDQIITGTRVDDKEGELIYVAGLLKNNQWALIFQQNVEDAYRDFNRARNVAVAVFIIGGLAIITMAVVVSRKMVERITISDQEKEMMNQHVIETGHLASLGELAAGIAHEINNPVAIMVEEAGWIEDLLEDEEFSRSENLEEFKNSLKQIRKQGTRARDITHKLLSFARRSDSLIDKVDINELIQEVVNLSAQQAKYNNVAIETLLSERLPEVQVSQTELQQVLFNLINNALDAIGKQGGKIQIRSWAQADSVFLHVKDDGPGIPDAYIHRIFEPFFTTKPVGKGTGLGLSICYGIISKLGGEIQVKSQVGGGASFEISLPVGMTAEGQDSPEQSSESLTTRS